MFPYIYTTLFPCYRRIRAQIGDEVFLAGFGNERLFGVAADKDTYVYLQDGIEVEFLQAVSLEPYAHLWQLNCNAAAPQGRRAHVVWTNKNAGIYEHHWGLRFEGNHEILLRAIQTGQKARVLKLPTNYSK